MPTNKKKIPRYGIFLQGLLNININLILKINIILRKTMYNIIKKNKTLINLKFYLSKAMNMMLRYVNKISEMKKN